MILRPTQASIFSQVQRGLRLNLMKLTRAQEQAATGKRILRPSDDATGTAVSLSVRRQLGGIAGFLAAIQSSRPIMAQASTHLQDASSALSEARALIIQSMNGTLNAQDRATIAGQIEGIEEDVLGLANSRWGGRYLFAGTKTETRPFRVELVRGEPRVVYDGDDAEQRVLVGRDVKVGINVPGSEIFGRFDGTHTEYSGLTGLASGTSADSGTGYMRVYMRNDSTGGALAAGIGFVGVGDTVLGDHTLVVDGAAGTITLGGGQPTGIPTPLPADFVVRDADGSELHLDLSGYTGGSFTTTVTGQGSISIDGTTYSPVTLAETDLELIDPSTGNVLHVDTTGVTRAGEELVTFAGSANLFDTLLGVASDLRDTSLSQGELVARLNDRLLEFDRGFDNLQNANATLGSRTARLDTGRDRLENIGIHLEALRSTVEDADLAQVALELVRAEQTLQIAQATGARLLQQTLLNYL